ncbi:MAG: DUF4785 family immunoglobulin-like domain-containing protein [Polyangiales bacterium]
MFKNLTGLVIILVGCANAPEQPAPAPTPAGNEPAPAAKTASPIAFHGDVSAKALAVRDPLTVEGRLIEVSRPVPTRDLLADEGATEWSTSTDAVKIAEAGTTTAEIPVDMTDGEPHLYLGPQGLSGKALDEALAAIKVLDPDGAQVNVRAFKPGVEGLRPMSDIPLVGKKPGIYRVEIGGIARRQGLAIDARLTASPIALKMKPSTYELLLGNDGAVDVELVDGASPIAGATIEANLVKEDLSPGARVQFTETAPGHYHAEVGSLFTAKDAVGAYLVDIRATGKTAGGKAFLRHGRAGFHFGIPTARVLSVSAPRTTLEPSGEIKAWEVDVTLESTSVDRLEVSGTLTAPGDDGQEHPVCEAFAGKGFGAGKQTVTLKFDAGHVRLTHLTGPYKMRLLKVFSLGTNTLFHREGLGRDTTIAPVSLDKMHMPKIDSSIQGMIKDGLLFAK